MQKSGHNEDDVQISALECSTRWMDERVVTSEKCWIGTEEKMPRDLKRSELNELVENLTCLDALEGKIGKVIRRS